MKLIASFLLLAAATQALAQENKTLTIKNLTYPEKVLVVECMTPECNEIRTTGFKNYDGSLRPAQVVSWSTIEETIDNRRKFRRDDVYRPYDITRATAKNAKKRYTEAYYGDAIGNSVLVLGTLVVDTAGLPISVIDVLTTNTHKDSRADRRGAKRFKLNFESDLNEITVKHKYFQEMSDYLESVSTSFQF